MSQLSEIRTAVQANWPDNYHSSFLTDIKTDEYINTTQRWVCRGTLIIPQILPILNYSFSWMKAEVTGSTVQAQRRYGLPDGSLTLLKFKAEISLELIDQGSMRKPLTRRYKQDIENISTYRDTLDKGTPRDYSIQDFDIWLYPLPDHARNASTAWTMNLEYYGYLADLSGNTDSNTLSADYPLILEYGATELGFLYGQDDNKAARYKALKQELMLEMIKADQVLDLSTETGLEPVAGAGLGEGAPGDARNRGYYYNDTPYGPT